MGGDSKGNHHKATRNLMLTMDEAEKRRLQTAAAARDLATASLAKLIILGALQKGIVDQLIQAGEKVTIGPVRRQFRNVDPKSHWQRNGVGWVHDGWHLIKHAKPADNKGGEDQGKWWHLSHPVHLPTPVPMAWRTVSAMEAAMDYITNLEETASP